MLEAVHKVRHAIAVQFSLLPPAASIWFEIWGAVDPGQKNSIF